jgi:hypothetical protein
MMSMPPTPPLMKPRDGTRRYPPMPTEEWMTVHRRQTKRWPFGERPRLSSWPGPPTAWPGALSPVLDAYDKR